MRADFAASVQPPVTPDEDTFNTKVVKRTLQATVPQTSCTKCSQLLPATSTQDPTALVTAVRSQGLQTAHIY